MTAPQFAPLENPTARTLVIDLLALDLDTCTRCVGTLANIEAAIDIVQQVLRATGTTISVRKAVVGSEAEARRHRFVSSPTIRINGRDIVFETLESQCDSCTDLCGCTEGTDCRVWRYHGTEFTEAPVGLIVEAILRGMTGSPTPAPTVNAGEYEVPANLRSFFAGKASRIQATAGPCCAPSEQATCCEPVEKGSCCSGPEPSSCGCR